MDYSTLVNSMQRGFSSTMELIISRESTYLETKRMLEGTSSFLTSANFAIGTLEHQIRFNLERCIVEKLDFVEIDGELNAHAKFKIAEIASYYGFMLINNTLTHHYTIYKRIIILFEKAIKTRADGAALLAEAESQLGMFDKPALQRLVDVLLEI